MHISCFLSGTFDKGLSQRRMNLQPGGPRGPRNRGWGLPQAPVIHLTSCMCDPPPLPKGTHPGPWQSLWLFAGLESLGSVNGKAWIRDWSGDGGKGGGWVGVVSRVFLVWPPPGQSQERGLTPQQS